MIVDMKNAARAVCDRTAWLLFWGILGSVVAAHLTTLSLSPLPWMDEVQIIEMGRTGLWDRHASWSMVVPDEGRSGVSLNYLGGALQEGAYRLFKGAFGPRFVSLLGLVAASILLQRILREKGVRTIWACGIALLYLVDPVVTQSVRGARVDVWTTVCTFLSVLLIRQSDQKESRERAMFLCVGAITALQLFIWASSVLQVPILMAEVWMLAEKRHWAIKSLAIWGLCGFIGALVVVAAVCLPFVAHYHEILSHFQTYTQKGLSHSFASNLAQLKGCAEKTLVVSVVGGCSIFGLKTNQRYLLFFAGCLVFLLFTRVYVHRYFYLIPYLLLSFGCAIRVLQTSTGFLRRVAFGCVAVALFYGYGYSVVLRNGVEFLLRGSRQHSVLVKTLRAEIGGQGTKIYSSTYQTYYAGRDLGWHQYCMMWGDWRKSGNARAIMSAVDWFLAEDVTTVTDGYLQNMGFVFAKTITIPSSTPARTASFARTRGRPVGYERYQLYRRIDDGS